MSMAELERLLAAAPKADTSRQAQAQQVAASPTPLRWRVAKCKLSLPDGGQQGALMLELHTATGVHVSFWTDEDAARLRDTITARLADVEIPPASKLALPGG